MRSRPHFVPSNEAGSRKDTAVLLVGTATEFNIPQRDISSAPAGFWISDALAAVLYDESEEVEEPVEEPPVKEQPKTKAKTAKKTSGDRAAKNTGTEQE